MYVLHRRFKVHCCRPYVDYAVFAMLYSICDLTGTYSENEGESENEGGREGVFFASGYSIAQQAKVWMGREEKENGRA